MPILALDLASTQTVESDYDTAKGTPEATKWQIGTLDSRVNGHIRDQATSFKVDATGGAQESVETTLEMSLVNFSACQFGLKGWTNFRDARGNDIPFTTRKRSLGGKSYTVVDEDVLRQVPGAIIVELGQKILAANNLTNEQGNA